jgi:SulP family sulfate permease
VTRALDLVLHFWQIDLATTTVGVVTVALIVALRRTRLGPMGLVVAVVAGSVLAAVLAAFDVGVDRIGNIVDVPNGLPLPAAPSLTLLPDLIVPALSLTFVGLVQGAGVSAAFANPDGARSDPSHDFVGQGVGNLVSGVFRGMPVGGSMSATSLVVSAGAKSRNALMLTGVVMAIVVLVFAPAVEYVAMPALAGLLIVVGFETIKPHNFVSVLKTGHVQKTVMLITFVLTLVVPLQFAVLVGIGLAATLHVVRQSNQVTVRRLNLTDGGRIRETDPPATIGEGEVIVIQPYGSLFFAAAPMLTDQLPEVDVSSDNSVVVVRLRGKPELGSTLIEVFETYATKLQEANCKLMIVTDSDRVVAQLRDTGAADVIGESNLYRSTQWLSETVRQAADDAEAWVDGRRRNGEGGQ